MRFAVGAMLFEGNTFSPVLMDRADFAAKYLHEGDEVLTRLAGTGTEIGGAIAEAARHGDELVPLIATHGGAGGRVRRAFTATLIELLINRIIDLGTIDGIYIALHGAFVSEDDVDVDGSLLRRLRALLPNTPLVVSCDLHAHITPDMIANCDALIGYKHYPHDDTFETGAKAMTLLRDIAIGILKPVLASCRIPLLAPAQHQRTRGDGPMVEVRALAESLAIGAVRDVSYFCVQPWIDAPGIGFTAVVTAHDDARRASDAARDVATAMWERRARFLVATHSARDAFRQARGANGLVVLVDAADCVGGGASGDSAAVLAALLTEAPDASAAIHLADPIGVAEAEAIGVGKRGHFAIGNRRDPSYGAPLQVEAEIVKLFDGHFVYSGGLMRGVSAAMGRSAVLRVGAIDLLLTSNACYEYADEAFLASGIDARSKRFIVVKNPMNYQQAYREAAASYVLETPGPTTPKLDLLSWCHAPRELFPVSDKAALRYEQFVSARR
jgi:microcystin degradation protein MlrC